MDTSCPHGWRVVIQVLLFLKLRPIEFQEKESFMDGSYDDATCTGMKQRHSMEMPNLRMLVSKIREQVTLNLTCLCVCQMFYMGFKTFLKFLLFVCFYLMATCSHKNLWQLICYGGEVLHGLWKIKDTSKRRTRRYTIKN